MPQPINASIQISTGSRLVLRRHVSSRGRGGVPPPPQNQTNCHAPPPPTPPFDSTCLSMMSLQLTKYVFPVLVWSRFGSDFLYTRAIFQLYCVDFFFKAIFYSQIGEWNQAPGITYSSPLFNLCGCLRRNCAEYGVCRLKSLRDWRRIM